MVKIGLFFMAWAAMPTEAWKIPFLEDRKMGEDYPEVLEPPPPIDPNLLKPPGFEHLTDNEIRELYNKMLEEKEECERAREMEEEREELAQIGSETLT